MTEIKKRAVILASGGLDSTVVAAYAAAHYDETHYLFADYGQKTMLREREAFDGLVGHFHPAGAEVIDLTWLRRIGKSALFEEGTTLTAANRKSEYVPARNTVLLAAATAMAETVGAGAILIGSTGGDRTCPDNSQAFINAFGHVIREGTMTEDPIAVVAPLIELDKVGVISLGLELGAPFELSWSCHNNGGSVACGLCSNCEARRGAFDQLGVPDPILYEGQPIA
ncbi:MAG TPA: 7-cyano-7-deazaguanine synthase [Patescibacteria group bacterium]|nr:7-cyano-7-deazaguanine synthase [Patescibacteria group bacterium]